MSNNLTAAMVAKILVLNILFHVLSGIFTGVWIADLVAPTGEMTLLTWLETIMSAVAIAAGLSYGSYIALTHIPTLPPAKRKQVMGIFVASYLIVALMLGLASSSVLASASGEVAHMEATLTAQTEATQARQRAAASLINRSSVMNDCESSAVNMSVQEAGAGVYSGEGGNIGQVATALTNISQGWPRRPWWQVIRIRSSCRPRRSAFRLVRACFSASSCAARFSTEPKCSHLLTSVHRH